MYSCGSLLSELFGQETSPEQTDIGSRVFVRANHACADQVETVYYSSGVFDDVCVHCGDPNDIFRGEEAADILLTCGSCFNECLRCTRDKYSPKLYSSANNMNPGVVPPQLMVRFYTSAILFVVLWLIFVLKVFCSLSFTV